MKNTIVLFGGRGFERRVSVASAQNIADQLIKVSSDFILHFISETLEIYEVEPTELFSFSNVYRNDFKPKHTPRFKSIFSDTYSDYLREKVIFNALHGDFGENGELQRHWEDRNLTFTGSGATASAYAFSKRKAKEIMRKAGALVPKEFSPAEVQHMLSSCRALEIAPPTLIYKPDQGGSSEGLQLLKKASDFSILELDKFDLAKEPLAETFASEFLCEEYIAGREFTVGVLELEAPSVDDWEQKPEFALCLKNEDQGGRHSFPSIDGHKAGEGGGSTSGFSRPGFLGIARVALSPSEVILKGKTLFDYEAKYEGVGVEEVTPANISFVERKKLQRIALQAHITLGCFGYSRVDLRVDAEGHVFFIELNTLPGLTKASFLPQQLYASGVGFLDFLQGQMNLSKRRNK